MTLESFSKFPTRRGTLSKILNRTEGPLFLNFCWNRQAPLRLFFTTTSSRFCSPVWVGYLTFGLSTHPPRRSACRDSFKNSLFLYSIVLVFCEIADFHRHALIFCSAFSAGPTTVRSGKPHAACAALRFAPLRWSALAFAGLTIVFYYMVTDTLFQFLSLFHFRLEDFFLGSAWSPFFNFSTGRLGSELRLRNLWDRRFSYFHT
jgi:hypothetical protein